MLFFNLPQKTLLLVFVMLLSSKSSQSISNFKKMHSKTDYFKLATKLVDSASSFNEMIKAGKIDSANYEIGWWEKRALGILCVTKFGFKSDENVGKLHKNICKQLENDENMLKIFLNDKETLGNLKAFVSNEKPIIDTKTILEKIKKFSILSYKNEENIETMLKQFIAGRRIISQFIKTKSLSSGEKRRRRPKRRYGDEQIRKQTERIKKRRKANSEMREICVAISKALIIFYFAYAPPDLSFLDNLNNVGFFICMLIRLSIVTFILFVALFLFCPLAFPDTEQILPLISDDF